MKLEQVPPSPLPGKIQLKMNRPVALLLLLSLTSEKSKSGLNSVRLRASSQLPNFSSPFRSRLRSSCSPFLSGSCATPYKEKNLFSFFPRELQQKKLECYFFMFLCLVFLSSSSCIGLPAYKIYKYMSEFTSQHISISYTYWHISLTKSSL